MRSSRLTLIRMDSLELPRAPTGCGPLQIRERANRFWRQPAGSAWIAFSHEFMANHGFLWDFALRPKSLAVSRSAPQGPMPFIKDTHVLERLP